MDLNQRPMQRKADMLTNRPQNLVDTVSEMSRTANAHHMLTHIDMMD